MCSLVVTFWHKEKKDTVLWRPCPCVACQRWATTSRLLGRAYLAMRTRTTIDCNDDDGDDVDGARCRCHATVIQATQQRDRVRECECTYGQTFNREHARLSRRNHTNHNNRLGKQQTLLRRVQLWTHNGRAWILDCDRVQLFGTVRGRMQSNNWLKKTLAFECVRLEPDWQTARSALLQLLRANQLALDFYCASAVTT